MGYNVPGVYIEEDQSLSLSVPAGTTAIPVFVGKFWKKRNNPTDDLVLADTQVVRIDNWSEFATLFDAGLTPGKMTITLGPKEGSKADVAVKEVVKDKRDIPEILEKVEVGETNEWRIQSFGYTAHRGGLSVRAYFENGGGPCYVLALKNGDEEKITDLIRAKPEISILCYCENNATEMNAVYGKFKELISNSNQGNPGYFVLADAFYDSTMTPDLKTAFGDNINQVAAYYPALQMIYRIAWPADDQIKLTGAPKSVSDFAALKKDKTGDALKVAQLIADRLTAESIVYLRASVVLAGIYARTDQARGVWKAPANVALSGVDGLVWDSGGLKPVIVDDDVHGKLNPQGINAIRHFSGRGYVVWGARTLAGYEGNGDLRWRYIPVRRLFNAAERDIKQAMRQVMFEPNNAPTWEKVRAAIDSYLHTLWRMGGLQGAKPEQAYFVQVGKDVTMSPQEIRDGKLIVKVGMAAVRPAEFIILQFSQNQVGAPA